MAGSTGFDPSREWLGIPAVDLADPFRVLGLSADEADAAAVHAAADRLLGRLQEIAPGPFRLAHESLQKRIHACRSEALAATAARDGTLRPPPVPVPTPPARDTGDAAADPEAARDVEIRLRRPPRRQANSRSPVPAILSLLAAVATAVAAYVVWPQTPAGGGKTLRPIADVIHQPTPHDAAPPGAALPPVAPASPSSADATPPPRESQPVAAGGASVGTAAPAEPDASSAPAPSSEPDATASELAGTPYAPTAGEAPVSVPADVQPRVDGPSRPGPGQQAGGAADIDACLRSALEAMRRGEFDVADEKTAEADRLVDDDDRLADRVAAWLQLTRYARRLSEFRARALLAAPDDCEVDGTVISIIESTPTMFKFKAAGRMYRVPPADVPPPIVDALVRRWFAAKKQPGNHVFLGCHLILRDPPDVDAAREEWAVAERDGQDVSALERLLDDPLIRAPRQ